MRAITGMVIALMAAAFLPNCSREARIRDGLCTSVEVKTMEFDLATFLEKAGLGRSPNRPSFRREIRLMQSSIFGRAAQNSPSFRLTGKKPPSRFSLPGN